MDKTFMFNDYLNSVMGKMTEMVRVINGDGKVSYTNESFDRHISNGVKMQDKYCYEALGFTAACAACPVRDVLSRGVSRQMTRKINGNTYAVSISPILDETGLPQAALEIYRDMTLDFNIKQTLMEQNSKMRKDLTLARSVQQALVKNVMPKVSGYMLYSGFFPCESVGGDMFDCIVGKKHALFYLADVSGHGVMPAMLGVFFSRSVKTAYSMGMRRPSEILAYVQEEFESLELSDSLYITAFVVSLEIKTGKFLFSNAGLSVAPIILNSDIEELNMSSLPVSKWFGRPQFADAESIIEPGGRLLIYSDGINDIHGDESVKNKLFELFKKEPFDSRDFIGCVQRDLHMRPEDDLTLLMCCRDSLA